MCSDKDEVEEEEDAEEEECEEALPLARTHRPPGKQEKKNAVHGQISKHISIAVKVCSGYLWMISSNRLARPV